MSLRSRTPSRMARALCLALLTLGGTAFAVPMPPGGVGTPHGQTAAGTPSLAGVVVQDKVIPFDCGAAFHGTLQSRVVRSNSLGTLDFYYRIINDATSVNGIRLVRAVDFSQAPTADADYRLDGSGTAAPSLITRVEASGDLVNFAFDDSPIDPGESSRLFYVRSGRTNYDAAGGIYITDSFTTCVVHETFRPLP